MALVITNASFGGNVKPRAISAVSCELLLDRFCVVVIMYQTVKVLESVDRIY